ncbi:rhomboid family intramembrane serine protease [Tundrisphaera sp. TA3]|uniref:rhomboid family intramembrane serine protease n=1 Tax=Tundrisphaera sp. TA3 TaxID=3435775 RepID=UPI003EC052ED
MREIGTIAEEKAARVLEDYLLTLGISTKLIPAADGVQIWVHREDRVEEARAVLEEFRKAPDDPRFRAASREARTLRQKAEQAEAEYRGNIREVSDRWNGPFHRRAPLTAALLAASILVAIGTDMGEPLTRVGEWLSFSTHKVETVGNFRVLRDNGLSDIEHGQFWRVLTPIFIHFGPIHLIFNMLALIALGERVESRKGWQKMAIIAVVAAVLGNIGQFFESGGSFGGMSGVLFALAGYLWAKGHADPEDGLALPPNAAFMMIAWFLFGIISKIDVSPDAPMPTVSFANVCHGVGLAVGIAFGLRRF